MSGDCGFMAANLYARSIFGEDALANVSIEIPVDEGPDAAVTGHIRIRAKSQVCDIFFCFGLIACGHVVFL
jgi:coatomer subunit beta